MKNAIVFSMMVLGLVGYLNLGQMIEADPWEDVNAQSTTNQVEAINNTKVDLPPDGPNLGSGDPRIRPERPWPDPN